MRVVVDPNHHDPLSWVLLLIRVLVLCEHTMYGDRFNDILECYPSRFRQASVLFFTEPEVYVSMCVYCTPFVNHMLS